MAMVLGVAVPARGVRTSRRPPSAAVALLAIAAWSISWLNGIESADFAVMAGTKVLNRPSADSRDDDSRHQAKRNGAEASSTNAAFNVTELEGSGFPDIARRGVTQEWVMRGEQDNVEAFQSWQNSHAAEPTKVKCTMAAGMIDKEVMCLQCFTHTRELQLSGTASFHGSGAVQAELVATFSDLGTCVSGTADGMGFCMSGRVTVPRR
mmetsp:Transcript_79177/g.220121  ORF Transcript_79177/g.220121 Transcript_79177/m.220121 type:complete len:208 (-) Transcript_79177:176-799(-)